MSDIMRNNTPKDRLINEIIQREFEMFDKVDNIGGRANCQDNFPTFYIMRYSQHSVLSDATLNSYKQDLINAAGIGRNLVMEKYGYMMEFSDPDYYHANLEANLPKLTEQKAQLIAQIVSLMHMQHLDFVRKYPGLAKAGRPMSDSEYATSSQTYLIGELKTYSDATLQLFLQDVQNNTHLVLDIQTTMAGFYGYPDLEAAENRHINME